MQYIPVTLAVDNIIGQVVITGNQRIEKEKIRSHLTILEGSTVDNAQIDRSLKNLFSTGLFADVTINYLNGELTVNVLENPVINRVVFEGNLRIKSDVLAQEIYLRPRMVYTRLKVQSDMQRLVDTYHRRGRFSVKVEPKVIQLEQNRVDLVFEIQEGQPAYIQKVSFIGNHQYSDSRLREVLTSKEKHWYRFMTTNDTYDPDRLSYDQELLRKFYFQHGYLDFEVLSASSELSLDSNGFFLTFALEEGERYRYGSITIDTKLSVLREQDLSKFIAGKVGDWYNSDEIEDSIQSLTDAAGSLGYAFVEVSPLLERNQDTHIVSIVYNIKEGPHVFIDQINISGNIRTRDEVIRREFRIAEGDAFNAAKLRRSRQRVDNLNFFEKVDMFGVPIEDMQDRTIIKVDVEEKSTGELSFGVGWSTTAGAMMEVGVRERNLLGRGQDLHTALTIGQRRTQVDLSFTEPYFLNRDLSAGFDVFAVQRNLQGESSYDSSSIGGSLRSGFNYNEYLRHSFNYTAKRDKVENVKGTASRMIKEQAGTYLQSLVGHTVSHDTRDSRINPSYGHIIRFGNDIAGLGGSDRFMRVSFDASQYFTISDQWILKFSTSTGYIVGVDKGVRIGQRYFLGGDNLRGFSSAGIGPRDKTSGDALGGNWLASGLVEVTFPLGLPKELGLSGKLFSDLGTLGRFDGLDTKNINHATTLRAAIGGGATWKSPIGPLSIDIGVPLKKESFDKKELLHFNFGTRF